MSAMIKATVAAVLVQPLVFVAWIFLPWLVEGASFTFKDLAEVLALSGYVWLFATCHVLFLGIPLFLILRRIDSATGPFVSATGFIAGAIPNAIYSWPLWGNSSGFSSGGTWHGKFVRFVIDGEVTIYGWFSYVESVLMFGVHGLVGAMIFYWVWRKVQDPLQGALGSASKVPLPMDSALGLGDGK